MNLRMTFACVLVFATAALACLWDRDTMRAEAQGMPGIVEVLTGRIHRHPPLYYEMRLQRVMARIAENPDDLEAYDDAGVALDRLGRSDEAIEVMAAKRARLDLRPDDTHEYRYLANLGTFHAHRWLRARDDRDRRDLEEARRRIAGAIELNPDAHFGREIYQLNAIEWLLDPSGHSVVLDASLLELIDERWYVVESTPDDEIDAAIEGLTGLMVLGDAWESIDVIHALGTLLQARGESTLAYLAKLRCEELIEQGHAALNLKLRADDAFEWLGQPGSGTAHDRFFHDARVEAERWRQDRVAFETRQLEAGLHPDTHPGFWNGWVEPAPPTPPGSPNASWIESAVIGIGGIASMFVLVGILVVLVMARQLDKRPAPA